jgi:hypothetical protein
LFLSLGWETSNPRPPRANLLLDPLFPLTSDEYYPVQDGFFVAPQLRWIEQGFPEWKICRIFNNSDLLGWTKKSRKTLFEARSVNAKVSTVSASIPHIHAGFSVTPFSGLARSLATLHGLRVRLRAVKNAIIGSIVQVLKLAAFKQLKELIWPPQSC